MKKVKKKKIITVFLFIVLLIFFGSMAAFAENITFTKEYTYNASDLDSKVSSRTIAMDQVKRLLLEELGVYLISETEVKDFHLTKDQITTYSAGIVSAEIKDEKWDGEKYWLKADVSADPKEVTKALQKLIENKEKTKELEEVRKRADQMSREIEKLKKENARAKAESKDSKTDQSAETIKQYNKAIEKLSLTNWLVKVFRVKQMERTFLVEVKIDKNPPTVGNNAISVYIKDDYGAALTDAEIIIKYSMPAMPGWPRMNYKARAELKGNNYIANVNFPMNGPWNIAVIITRGSKTSQGRFNFDVIN